MAILEDAINSFLGRTEDVKVEVSGKHTTEVAQGEILSPIVRSSVGIVTRPHFKRGPEVRSCSECDLTAYCYSDPEAWEFESRIHAEEVTRRIQACH